MTSRQLARVAPAHSRRRNPADVCAMVRRFDARIRPDIGRLVAADQTFEDMMWTFPGVLHALACGEAAGAANADVRALIRYGAPLRVVAAALSLPMWARNLSPEAFCGRLPRLPRSPDFAMRITNRLPRESTAARGWVNLIATAAGACDDGFALWVARERQAFDSEIGLDGVAILGLFAWYSARDDLEAHLYIDRPWRPEMGAWHARDAALNWLCALEVPLYGGVREQRLSLANPVLEASGLAFVRLRTARDLVEEGRAMNHCVGSYLESLARGCSFFYSLRRTGTRVATLQIGFRGCRHGPPEIQQLYAHSNTKVSEDVHEAVRAWLAGWNRDEKKVAACGCENVPDRGVWMRLWKPYWIAKGLTDAFAARPRAHALAPAYNALWRCFG